MQWRHWLRRLAHAKHPRSACIGNAEVDWHTIACAKAVKHLAAKHPRETNDERLGRGDESREARARGETGYDTLEEWRGER